LNEILRSGALISLKFLHQISAGYVCATPSIDNDTANFVIYKAPSWKQVLPLVTFFLLNLHIENSPCYQ